MNKYIGVVVAVVLMGAYGLMGSQDYNTERIEEASGHCQYIQHDAKAMQSCINSYIQAHK